MKKGNSQNNKKKKKYNWEYHEKLNQKYESYLFENIDKNNLRLKGNYHYENKPLEYYLNQKESDSINNSNLTPLPQSKYLNNKTKEKNIEDYKKFTNIQKSVVEMRRIEYTSNFNKKKSEKINDKEIKDKKETKKEKKVKIDIRNEQKLDKPEIIKSKRKSCFQFPYSIKLFEKKRKTMSRNEINEYIFKNLGKIDVENMPKDVQNQVSRVKSCIIRIQKRYKLHLNNLKKIIKIQVNYRAYYYSRLYKEFSNRKEKISKLIFTIQKVLFLNLYHLKINPNKYYSSKKCFISKNIYKSNYLNKLVYLQKEIKTYLSYKNLKRIYGKKKCVYIKPLAIKPLGKIRLLQRNIHLFLERLKRRRKLPKSQLYFKKITHTQKIILIQRFAKAIHEERINPLIPKDNFNKNNIFAKSNRKYAHKKTFFINTKIIPFNPKKINKKVKNRDSKITKTHKYLEKLIFLQKYIKIYLSRDDYDIYDYPKCEEYITKDSYVLPDKENVLLLQRQIKFFLYRQKIKANKIHKVVILPLKITKTIRTNTEKIFMRLSKLRIMYDKNLIFFIVKFIETIKRYLGRISFDLIMKESKRKKLFSVKGGKFRNVSAKPHLVKKVSYKVVEPHYKFTPIKPVFKKSFTNKNAFFIGLNLDKNNDPDFKEKSKTKRSEKSLLSNKEDIKENNDEKEKESQK